MAKRAIAVTRVVPTTPIRYETVGIIIGDIDRITPVQGVHPATAVSVVRFKRAGVPDIMTPHAVADLVGAINGDINLALKEDE